MAIFIFGAVSFPRLSFFEFYSENPANILSRYFVGDHGSVPVLIDRDAVCSFLNWNNDSPPKEKADGDMS